MERSEVEKEILSWISSHSSRHDGGHLSASTPVLLERWVTSLQIAELLLFLEDTYDLELTVDTLKPENFQTAATIADLVLRVRDASHG